MTNTERTALIELAYHHANDDLADQIVMCDEELTGVSTPTMSADDLNECLNYWLSIASERWVTL